MVDRRHEAWLALWRRHAGHHRQYDKCLCGDVNRSVKRDKGIVYAELLEDQIRTNTRIFLTMF